MWKPSAQKSAATRRRNPVRPFNRHVLTSVTQQEYVLTEADSPRAPELAALETRREKHNAINATAVTFLEVLKGL